MVRNPVTYVLSILIPCLVWIGFSSKSTVIRAGTIPGAVILAGLLYVSKRSQRNQEMKQYDASDRRRELNRESKPHESQLSDWQ
jgi:hypothetical protein